MICTVAALVSISSGTIAAQEVAFIARYYYPYPDKRISAHQVYVCDLNGSNRLQLTTGKLAPGQLTWVRKGLLCWVENTGVGRDQLVLYDLKRRRKTVLLKGNGTFQREGGYDLFVSATFPEYNDGVTRYKVTAAGVKAIGRVPRFDSGRWSEKKTWRLAGEPEIRFTGYEEDDAAVNKQFPEYDYIYTFERDGRRYQWRLQGGLNEFYKGDKSGSSLLHSVEGGGSAGTWECLYEVTWETGGLNCLISDVYGIALRRGSPYWSAREPGRSLSPYGPEKNVWTCEAYVGDLRTRKQWSIASGLVECYDIALAPGG